MRSLIRFATASPATASASSLTAGRLLAALALSAVRGLHATAVVQIAPPGRSEVSAGQDGAVRCSFGGLGLALDVFDFTSGAEPTYCGFMCRSIKPLNNFEPPATREEVHAAALQYVRKVGGATHPAAANQAAYDAAVAAVAAATESLLNSLVTTAPPKNREIEAAKARARAESRYGPRN